MVKNASEQLSQSVVGLVSCPLQKGVAAALVQFVYHRGETIIDYDQYVDVQRSRFFARLEWSPISDDEDALRSDFTQSVAIPFDLQWQLYFSSRPVRIGVFVTRETAHLYNLVVPVVSGKWNASIPLIICNHPDLETEAQRFGIDYHCVPITKDNKAEQELRQLQLLQNYRIDLVVLARYMQIVTKTIIEPFRNRIINIHHSLLPAFVGANPYQQAYDRGVKLIGATSHYVTEELDAGPIIAQETTPVDHTKTAAELTDLGRELETTVLRRAVDLHVKRRIMVDRNRTIVFT
jgi:formyltetrahydrofolate deformylase